MNWRDKQKIINKGFLIIRERNYEPIVESRRIEKSYQIYYCSGNSSWKLLGNCKYKTKKLRRAAMNELLKDEKIIED